MILKRLVFIALFELSNMCAYGIMEKIGGISCVKTRLETEVFCKEAAPWGTVSCLAMA